MKQITLQNFNKATLKSYGNMKPEFSHQILDSGIPVWKAGIFYGGVSNAKNDTIYPLVPPMKLNSLDLGADYGLHTTSFTYPLTQSQKGDIYVITSKAYVLGIDSTGVKTNYGQFLTPSTDWVDDDIVCFNSDIIVTYSGSGLPYHKPEDNSGSWTTFGSFTNPSKLETFAQWLYIGDKSSYKLRYIKIFDTSLTEITPAFDIGATTDIVDFRNIDDTYMAVVGKTIASYKYRLYFWDGTPGSSYIKSVPISGYYIGIVNVSGNWYVLSQDVNDIVIYLINGLTLQESARISGVNAIRNGISKVNANSFDTYIVVPVNVYSLAEHRLLFYSPTEKELFTMPVDYAGEVRDVSEGIASTVDEYGNPLIYTFDYHTTGTDTTYHYTTTLQPDKRQSYMFSSSYPGRYISNWLKGDTPKIKINKIEVYYDKTLDTSDSISLSLITKDYLGRTDYTSNSIGTITSSDSGYRKIFSVGKNCSEFKIDLTITHSGTNVWSGAVNKIIVYYDELRSNT